MIRIVAMLGLLAASFAAQAHLLPKQNATMNIVDNAVFFVVSVPVSALKRVDDDANGLLSDAEIQRHGDEIRKQFVSGFKVTADQQLGRSVLTWVLPPQTDGQPTDVDYVIVMHRVNFPVAPQQVALNVSLFGLLAGESQMTLTATRGTSKEVAILNASAPNHTFFLGPISIFGEFIKIGVEHVLTGVDHLVFLLTILVAGAGLRYWLGVVTAFTVAHSITLSLAVLDIVQVPASIVEPGVAASIVLMAALNLYAGTSRASTRMSSQVAIVFLCGLLHGFGFASAIGVQSIVALNQLAALAGFNIGIELGQLFFVGTVLLAFATTRRLGQLNATRLCSRFSSALAATCGAVWFAQALMSAR